jgi:hypothetical protein
MCSSMCSIENEHGKLNVKAGFLVRRLNSLAHLVEREQHLTHVLLRSVEGGLERLQAVAVSSGVTERVHDVERDGDVAGSSFEHREDVVPGVEVPGQAEDGDVAPGGRDPPEEVGVRLVVGPGPEVGDPGLLEVGHVTGFVVEPLAEASGSALVHEGSPALLRHDEPALLQNPDRALSRHRGDVEHLGQLAVGRQLLARLKVAGRDLVSKLVSDLEVWRPRIIQSDGHGVRLRPAGHLY